MDLLVHFKKADLTISPVCQIQNHPAHEVDGKPGGVCFHGVSKHGTAMVGYRHIVAQSRLSGRGGVKVGAWFNGTSAVASLLSALKVAVEGRILMQRSAMNTYIMIGFMEIVDGLKLKVEGCGPHLIWLSWFSGTISPVGRAPRRRKRLQLMVPSTKQDAAPKHCSL
jgi:hypothetical protein